MPIKMPDTEENYPVTGERKNRETHLSTTQLAPQANPWIPQAKQLSGGKQGAEEPPRQGAQATDGVELALGQGLSKWERLLKRSDFIRVQRVGVRIQTRHFTILVAKGPGLNHHRLGITTGRHVGGAVRRNRIRRLLREYFRAHKREIIPDLLEPGADIVVIVRRNCPDLGLEDVMRELADCWQKL